jgi:hypothetical protein
MFSPAEPDRDPRARGIPVSLTWYDEAAAEAASSFSSIGTTAGPYSLTNKEESRTMAESPRQKRITGRVMHEFKHGELKSGRGGKAGKVKNRRQAIAIALQEAGASKYDSARRNRRNLHRTERKEARGETPQQEREGKSHIGARRKRESTKAMSGRNARKQTARGHRAAVARAHRSDGYTRQELYERAKKRHVEGRSKMTKRQLENALGLS